MSVQCVVRKPRMSEGAGVGTGDTLEKPIRVVQAQMFGFQSNRGKYHVFSLGCDVNPKTQVGGRSALEWVLGQYGAVADTR